MTLAAGNGVQTIAFLQVKVWDFNQFSTYEAAIGNGKTAASTVFTYRVPLNGPPQDYYMDGLQAFGLVPVPSIVALGVVGLFSLVMLRRSRGKAMQTRGQG